MKIRVGLLLLFSLITEIGFAQKSSIYPGKGDLYFSGIFNYRPNEINLYSYQGLKSGYYISNSLGLCAEAGFIYHSQKLNNFILNDKVSGQYVKLGLEMYHNLFKKRPNYRILFGFDFGISKNITSRTYKYSGPIYGARLETLNYNYNANIKDLHFGFIYISNPIRITGKAMLSGSDTKLNEKPYTLYGMAGNSTGLSFEMSVGYQLIKPKSKPYNPKKFYEKKPYKN